MFKKVLAAIATAAVAISLAGCAPAKQTTTDLTSLMNQELKTHNCGDGFVCGKVTAPIDWNNPTNGTIELAFTYKPVDGVKKFLFTNPGGPGASGVDFVTENLDTLGTAKLRASYNIVGFDPRGTKGSAPVKCFTPKKMDEFLYTDTGYEAGTPQDLAVSRAAIAEYVAACKKNSGPSLGFLDTVSAAKDLELLRAVFNQEKLDYLGFSYGTFLGTTYAALYPSTVGRFVMDGAVDPTVSDEDQNYNQLVGFDQALRNYMKDCQDNQADCPFAGTVDQGLEQISLILSKVEKEPLDTMSGRKAGLAVVATGMYLTLYSNEYWTYLTQAFNEANQLDGSLFLQLADFYNSRNEDGTYKANEFEAFIAINCLDGRSDSSAEAVSAQNKRMLAASKTLGRFWQNGAEMCAHWPFPVSPKPASYAAEGSPKILVIGTTGDPATPYKQSVALAHTILANGFLLTFKGEGHTAYGRSNDCVSNVVDRFLIDGVLPNSEPTC